VAGSVGLRVCMCRAICWANRGTGDARGAMPPAAEPNPLKTMRIACSVPAGDRSADPFAAGDCIGTESPTRDPLRTRHDQLSCVQVTDLRGSNEEARNLGCQVAG
jgi:hypothetical protein